MNGIAVAAHPLRADFALEIAPPFAPAPEALPRVEEIWAEQKRLRGDRLTNGQIYTLAEHSPDRLVIQPAEYRYVLARRLEPGLAERGLPIQAVAVSGILECADGVVLGRRGDHVAADPGKWEAAPAGGLTRPDAVAQLLEELREELGLTPSQVTGVEACGLIEDLPSGVFDIVFKIVSNASAEAVRWAQQATGTDEYSELAVVPRAGLAVFLEDNRADLLPILAPMLGLAGY